MAQYYLKKPCKKCGGIECFSNRRCKKCQIEYVRKLRKDNPNYVTIEANRHKNNTENLVKTYVSKIMIAFITKRYSESLITREDIPLEIIEVKRLQLQLTRLINSIDKQLI